MLFSGFSEWWDKNRNLVFIIVIVLIIAFFALITIINVFIKKHHFAKSVKEVEKKYEYYRALLVGQDSSYLKRIYAISSCNLLYVETYTELLKKYEFLLQAQDEQAQNALQMLKDSLDKTKRKANKESIKHNREVLNNYFSQVEDFSKELVDLLKNEEEAQNKVLSQKEELRKIKALYFEHEGELKLVEESFDLLFRNIDEAFKRLSEQIDCAQYEEVDKILSRIDLAIKELNPVIEQLPLLCVKVTNVIPNKISTLKYYYQELVDDGYPLNHLRVNSTIEEFEISLKNITQRLKSFDLYNCDADLEAILKRINGILDKFENEKTSKEEFENEVNRVYSFVKSLDNKTVTVCNIIPEVCKSYLLADKYFNEIDVIKYNMSRLDTIKRTLDNYIHSTTKQPYSLLRDKCRELDNEAKIASQKLNEFSNYLLSLESDLNDANEVIYQGYFELRKASRKVHETYVEEYATKKKEQINKAFMMIDEINKMLKVLPIDMNKINNLIMNFIKYKDDLIKSIDQENEFATSAESLVVYANRERYHLSDIKDLLGQVETSFFDGEFERSYLDAGNATKKLKNASNSPE